MISHGVKQKRRQRRQREEAIFHALNTATVPCEPDGSCYHLNWHNGIAGIRQLARDLAKWPMDHDEQCCVAMFGTDSDVATALGNRTAYTVLKNAGLVT